MNKPELLVLASGSKDGGGSGFENLVNASRNGVLDGDIGAVISNISGGGVEERAQRLKIPFFHFPGPFTSEGYTGVVDEAAGRIKNHFSLVCLSGWMKKVYGLPRDLTINIHPGPMPGEFGGPGKHGHHVHEAVLDAFHQGRLTHSAVSMHFVTDGSASEYDSGPRFFSMPVEILADDTPETLAARVNAAEHHFQPLVTNWVLNQYIKWNNESLVEWPPTIPDWVPNTDIPVVAQVRMGL